MCHSSPTHTGERANGVFGREGHGRESGGGRPRRAPPTGTPPSRRGGPDRQRPPLATPTKVLTPGGRVAGSAGRPGHPPPTVTADSCGCRAGVSGLWGRCGFWARTKLRPPPKKSVAGPPSLVMMLDQPAVATSAPSPMGDQSAGRMGAQVAGGGRAMRILPRRHLGGRRRSGVGRARWGPPPQPRDQPPFFLNAAAPPPPPHTKPGVGGR